MIEDILSIYTETEEVRRKRKELREAQTKAMEGWKKELIPMRDLIPFSLLKKSESEFRESVEAYAKEHPDEKVEGTAVDKANLRYRGVLIEKGLAPSHL